MFDQLAQRTSPQALQALALGGLSCTLASTITGCIEPSDTDVTPSPDPYTEGLTAIPFSATDGSGNYAFPRRLAHIFGIPCPPPDLSDPSNLSWPLQCVGPDETFYSNLAYDFDFYMSGNDCSDGVATEWSRVYIPAGQPLFAAAGDLGGAIVWSHGTGGDGEEKCTNYTVTGDDYDYVVTYHDVKVSIPVELTGSIVTEQGTVEVIPCSATGHFTGSGNVTGKAMQLSGTGTPVNLECLLGGYPDAAYYYLAAQQIYMNATLDVTSWNFTNLSGAGAKESASVPITSTSNLTLSDEDKNKIREQVAAYSSQYRSGAEPVAIRVVKKNTSTAESIRP